MGFETLLGNEQLKENLTRSLQNGRISHFYLISGPAGSGKHTLATLLAAAILCRGKNKPCGDCTPCRKVTEGNHPDFITVDDSEKKTVSVELVRNARADIYIQPNESEHKIYLFPRAQDMRIEAQNALLKVLEEPPKYGVFLLLADNPESLLPTVRSRCTELALRPLPDALLKDALRKDFPEASDEDLSAALIRSGGFLGQARHILQEGNLSSPQTQYFLHAFAQRDTWQLVQALVPMEKWKREQLISELQQWCQLLESALACRFGMPAVTAAARDLAAKRSPQDIKSAITCLQKAILYAQGNVSPAAICGYLSWELR